VPGRRLVVVMVPRREVAAPHVQMRSVALVQAASLLVVVEHWLAGVRALLLRSRPLQVLLPEDLLHGVATAVLAVQAGLTHTRAVTEVVVLLDGRVDASAMVVARHGDDEVENERTYSRAQWIGTGTQHVAKQAFTNTGITIRAQLHRVSTWSDTIFETWRKLQRRRHCERRALLTRCAVAV
jgi:hypothetical protein